MNSVAGVILSRRSSQHVERGFGHVCVRVFVRFVRSIKDAFHRRDIDDVFVRCRDFLHQRFQASVQNERGDRVDELHLKQLDGRNIGEAQPPAVDLAKVDLLKIAVELPGRKELFPALRVSRREGDL